MRRSRIVTLYLAAFILAVTAVWVGPDHNRLLAGMKVLLPQASLLLALPLLACREPRLLALWCLAALELLWICPPALHGPSSEPGFTVVTWNLYHQSGSPPKADILALQEASHHRPVGYPYVHEDPDSEQTLCSRWPILEQGAIRVPGDRFGPRGNWARLERPDGGTLVLANLHPVTPMSAWQTLARNEQLRAARREVVEPALARGEPVLLLGDFNLCERDRFYGEVTTGLTDAFRAVGFGWQTTWGPPELGLGLLRIDYVLCGPGLTPLRLERLDRGPSDHFPLRATLKLQ